MTAEKAKSNGLLVIKLNQVEKFLEPLNIKFFSINKFFLKFMIGLPEKGKINLFWRTNRANYLKQPKPKT